MSYNDLFTNLGLDRVCFGNASSYQLAISLCAEEELLKKNDSVFNKTLLEKLSKQFELVRNFLKVLDTHKSQPYFKMFAYGPSQYDNGYVNNIRLDQVKLKTLSRGLISRIAWALGKLFRNENHEFWDCTKVSYNNVVSASLSDFADTMKTLYFKMSNDFPQSFDDAIHSAVMANNAEKREDRFNANKQSVLMQKEPEQNNEKKDVQDVECEQPIVHTVSLKNVKKYDANFWKKRMEEQNSKPKLLQSWTKSQLLPQPAMKSQTSKSSSQVTKLTQQQKAHAPIESDKKNHNNTNTLAPSVGKKSVSVDSEGFITVKSKSNKKRSYMYKQN